MKPLFRCLGNPRLMAIGLLLAASGRMFSQAIPEPSLVLYGVVKVGNIRMTAGRLVWQFQSALRTVTASTALTNINDQFSYLLQVPCETEVGGYPASSNVLGLISVPRTYNRSQVVIVTEGTNYSYPVFVNPAQTNFSIASADRGRIERVDLQVQVDLTDLDGNGLPDYWERQYFGYIGVDPNDDPDFDGMSNYAEYRAGTNPLDPNSRFDFVNIIPEGQDIRVEWPGVDGIFYVLQRSSELTSGFSNLVTHIPGTPPVNIFRDTNALSGGAFFYRLQIEN